MHSFVRRGVEMASEHLSNPPDHHQDIQVSGWLLALCALTSLAFMLAMWSVDYTYGSVVATLAAVEDTDPDLYVRLDSDFDPHKPTLDPIEKDQDGAPVPITNKLRTALAHLRARAGPSSRFRGFAMYFVYGIARGSLFVILPLSPDQFLGQFATQTVLAVLLATLQMAWVHIVISKPSEKRFYQRIPGCKDWMRIAPVAAFENVAVGVAFFLPLSMAKWFGGWDAFVENASSSTGRPSMALCQMWAMAVVPSLLSYLVSIPVQAIFVRVAASMLPEEDESIVPFDRSFGGKVVPAILGGSGRLSIADAWRTFDRPARVRYLKVIGKAVLIQFALLITFTLALLAQFSLMGVDTMQRMMANSA